MPVPGNPALSIPQTGTYYPHPMVPVRKNLAQIPNFELAGFAGTQIFTYQATLTENTNTSFLLSGARSAKQVATGTATQLIEDTNTWGVSPGESITFSGYVYNANATAKHLGIGPREWDATGAFSNQAWNDQTCAAGKWTRLVATHTPAATSVRMGWVITGITTVVGDTFYFDHILVERGTTVGRYFDGSSPGCWWEGTTNDAESGASIDGPGRVNHTYNPRVATDMANVGGTPANTRVELGVGGAPAPSAEMALAGIKYAAKVSAVADYNYIGFNSSIPTFHGQVTAQSVYVYIESAATVNDAVYMQTNNGIEAYGDGISASAANVGRWIRMSSVSPAWDSFSTAGAGMIVGYVGNTGTKACTFYATGVVQEEASAVGAFFDGDYLNCAWQGTANNSASRQLSPGGTWFDTGASPPGSGKTELKFPPAGIVTSSPRTIENRITLPRVSVGDLTVPGYVFEQPALDSFARADQNSPIGTGWTDGDTSVVYKAQVKGQRVAPLSAVVESGAGSYFKAAWTTPLAPPCAWGCRLTSLPTRFDNYMELGLDTQYVPFANPAFVEFSMTNRPEWDPEFVNGTQLSRRSLAGAGGVLTNSVPVSGGWVAGDEVAISYDGASVTGWRRPRNTASWKRLVQASWPELNNRMLYPSFWFSNYPVATGGGGSWDNFWFARF